MSDTRTPGYGQVDRDYGLRLATTPPEDDGPIWMVNLMAYRERAVYDGAESDVSGREADDRYAPVEVLADIGAQVAFVADVEDQLLGESPRWDRVGIVRYPTRRSFIDMQSRDDFRAKHVHKEAGMAETIVAGCVPVGPAPDAGLAGGVVVLRATTGAVPSPLAGARGSLLLDVEGTIVGDGRRFTHVAVDWCPSPPPLDDGADYALILRPSVDRLAESVAGSSS
ncbi:MAG: hypothetical protein ACLGIC_13620 [Acidimicrobiia bacterium]